ncbi:MAG: hypothetical protein RLN63_03445, partial [Miltoncostaeaceae bacterium]
MGAGDHHGPRLVVLQPVRVVRVVVERVLQHADPRQPQPLDQGHDVGGDDAEVLGDQAEVRALLGQAPEQRLPGAR